MQGDPKTTSQPLRSSFESLGSCLPAPASAQSYTRSGGYYLSAVGPGSAGGAASAEADLAKSETGEGQFKLGLVDGLGGPGANRTAFWCWCGRSLADCPSARCDPETSADFHPVRMTRFSLISSKKLSWRIQTISASRSAVQPFTELLPGAWRLFFSPSADLSDASWTHNASFPFLASNVTFATEHQGGIYQMLLWGDSLASPNSLYWTVAPPNSVSILWQVL